MNSPAVGTDAEVCDRIFGSLNDKERQVFAILMTRAGTNRQVAESMNTSEQRIKNILRAVYNKTGMSDRLELAVFTYAHPALLEKLREVISA